MNRINKFVNNALIVYIFLPFVIFAIGWLKWWISVPVCAILVICLIKNITYNDGVNLNKISDLYKLIPVAIIIVVWIYISGIGGMVFQNRDHICRNAMFNILVNEKWPVIGMADIGAGIEKRGLVYYIGYWLPAAVVGKIFGLQMGYVFQMLWALLGVFLVSILAYEHFGSVSCKLLLVFIFFSGLDIIGCILVGADLSQLKNFMHIEWWSGYQYSSFTTQLFWVYNQAIYAWIITAMIMRQTTNRFIVLIWSTGLLTCTFPFVGMIPFVVYKIIENTMHSSAEKIEISKTKRCGMVNIGKATGLFTYENVIAGGCIGIISFLYVVGNTASSKKDIAFRLTKGSLFLYVLFLFLEIGIYALAMYKYQYSNPLYWICIIVLMLCPWVRIGSGGDFCMRASIPGLLLFFVLIMKTMYMAKERKDNITIVIVSILLLFGSVTPLCEIGRTTTNTVQLYYTGESIMANPVSYEEIMGANNFSSGAEYNFFFKYLAK